jgi:2-O-(6-phospho-alpha-D-mannosyl)-D-glycerate hydrolase
MDRLYFVVHTHWDREWYQPFQQMRARLVEMADRMLPMVESGALPSFHFDGQTIVLEDYLEVRPDAARGIAKLVRASKLQIGPWYVLADSFLVSGESLIRNLEIGLQIARRFGPALDAGYLPDQFGHIAQMPQILAGFGFRTAVLWRGVGADVVRNRFMWEAPDGSSVLTIYLPHGYSNGANLPLDTADVFLARARDIATRERKYADGVPILVMNGTDHAIPDERLMQRVADARDADLSIEVGPLETYLKRLAELPVADLATHRGELRSPLRAHLLPSVTSARTWIKQRDFQNCRTLERLADPLAALAHALGRARGLDAFLDLAWKIELQNHPHDSICGCSVDQVHEDMRYRFDQAAMIAEGVVRRASAALLRDGAAGPPGLAVFNPTFARRVLVSGEVELPDPSARYVLEGPGAARAPVVTEPARAGRLFEVEMAAAEFKATVAGLSEPALMGRTVSRYELREPAAGRIEVDLLMTRSPAAPADLAEFKSAVANSIPDTGRILIRATEAARASVSFVASGLAQAGFTFYRLVRDDSPTPAVSAAADSFQSITNEFFSVAPGERGVEIRDVRSNEAFELYFEDDGDRGDEYNYDPVSDAGPISVPASTAARLVERGPVRHRLQATLRFEIPRALAPGRAARAPETEPLDLELTATLYGGLERIDFDVSVTNRSRDHRLRAALRTPIAASEAVHDTSFGIVRRSLRPSEPPGTEDIYPTVPHRTFTAVEAGAASAALMSRGIYEVEVRPDAAGSTILLTLLRAVGWLSRSDLKMRRGGAGPELETPGAQELGQHRFEFAMSSFSGGYAGDSGFIQLAAAYAYPPRAFAATAPAAAPSELQLASCDNPRIAFSTARPGPRPGAYRLRAYSMSEQAERARLGFGAGRRVRMIDLAGRPVRERAIRRRRDGSVELELRPFEIATFEVAKKNFHRDRKKY